jgi:hypothetical protein
MLKAAVKSTNNSESRLNFPNTHLSKVGTSNHLADLAFDIFWLSL